MRVGVLGSLVLDTGTGEIPVGGARLRALLARLALDAGRAVPSATLLAALWDDDPAGHGKALQSLASRLRAVLGDSALLTSGPAGYRLAVEPDTVDAARFERLARAGRHALALAQPAEAAAVLREALGLWRGPALADVREAPFAFAEADRLERARLAALEDRVDADLALGIDQDLVAELESLTAEHPLRERLHAQLIRALAGAGRGAEALAVYQRIRELLADRFGSDPGPRVQQAHLAVLRGDAPGPRRPAGNLDVPLTSFVGRDDEVRDVVGLLDRARLVTLVGPGGAGKTRLANTIGRRLTPAGGVWFVALAPVDADGVPGAVRDVLQAARPVAPDEVVDRLVETLADDDLVLVLDNCEHLIEAAATLAATLLGRCPRLRVLATSREPLRIDGETVHRVGPLEVPEPGATPRASRACAAIRLFHDRATAARPGFTLDGDTLAAAVEICRRLDGLPLAIELAAARLRTLPVAAIAARLDDRFRLLTGGSRIALPRQQTLRAAVAWSWDLLDAGERTLLERLSVVPGGITEDAAEAIGGVGDVPESLAALVEKSLLQPVEHADPVRPRYRLLETIRAYGLERLARRAELDALCRRHAEFFAGLAETADPRLRTSDQLRWLARLTEERDNLSAAIRWAVDVGEAGMAVRLGAALCWFWSMRDHPPESVDLLDRILRVPGPTEPGARAVVVAAHALALVDTGRPDQAEAALDRLAKVLVDTDLGTHPVLDLARLAVALGTARDLLADPDERPDPWSRSYALLMRGVLAMNLGHTTEASGPLTRALAGFEELGERWGLATTLSTLHTALRRSGEADRAAALNERATRCFRELGLPELSMENQVGAALHRARAGDLDGGRRELVELLERAGTAESKTLVRLGLARLEWRAGRPGPAREHARAGLAETPSGRSVPPHLTTLLLAVLAQADQAISQLDHPAVRLMLTVHTPVVAGIAAVVAEIELGRERPERAARLLGFATTLRGWDDFVDVDPGMITRRAADALGAKGFAAAHAAGAAMSRTEAQDLVSAIITAPGVS